jgi:hypothetical protein
VSRIKGKEINPINSTSYTVFIESLSPYSVAFSNIIHTLPNTSIRNGTQIWGKYGDSLDMGILNQYNE